MGSSAVSPFLSFPFLSLPSIFRKLKSYVIYRFTATIQIVAVLTILIFVANCPINSLFIILLALFNDLRFASTCACTALHVYVTSVSGSMLPVAYDRQQASAGPEHPGSTVHHHHHHHLHPLSLLTVPVSASVSEQMWPRSYCCRPRWACCRRPSRCCGRSCLTRRAFLRATSTSSSAPPRAQSGVWVQIFIAAELLIFSARTPSFIHRCIAPSPALSSSVLLFCLLVSVIACASSFFGNLYVQDVVLIWVYDIVCLLVLDAVKVVYFHLSEEDTQVLADVPDDAAPKAAEIHPSNSQTSAPAQDVDVEAPAPPPALAESVRADSVLTQMAIDAGSRTNSSANRRGADPALSAVGGLRHRRAEGLQRKHHHPAQGLEHDAHHGEEEQYGQAVPR